MTMFEPPFEAPVGAERPLLMLPLNVVMTARVRGDVDPERLRAALEKLRARHAFLAVRTVLQADGAAFYTTSDVPALPLRTVERSDPDRWLDVAVLELRTPFPMESGPLMRFTLLKAEQGADLVVCGHHAACDGISLTYLIRDILEHLADPSKPVAPLPSPPMVSAETVPDPPTAGLVARAVLALVNRAWRKKGLRFDFDAMRELHERYWEKNAGARLLAWQLPEADTASLVSRCRDEGVTVNSALWAAFLVAQHEVQGSDEPFRSRAGLAISTRDKLRVPVGEALGFYAASHKVQLHGYQGMPFWGAARTVHEQLRSSIDAADPFQVLVATRLDPTLLDSLYFSKYGLAPNRLSDKLLKKMAWDGISFGFAITNVGRTDIPTAYGDLKLDAVYGPCVYSDVNEKTVGVITLGSRAAFVMSYNEDNIDAHTTTRLRDRAVELLTEAGG